MCMVMKFATLPTENLRCSTCMVLWMRWLPTSLRILRKVHLVQHHTGSMMKLSILLLVICLLKCSLGRYLVGADVDLEAVDHEAVDRLEHKLFPHRHSRHHPAYQNNEIRRLAIEKDPYDNNTVVCSFCKKLETCSVLNNKLIEEVYLPKDTSAQETCNVIEKLGQRVSKEIFGHGRTFRDTPQCRG